MSDMNWKLFIDDLRLAPDSEWTVARSSLEAIARMRKLGCPVHISFDHDLGDDDTAMSVVKWLIDTDLDDDGRFIPASFIFTVHSANPVGAANIRGLLDAYLSHRQSDVKKSND